MKKKIIILGSTGSIGKSLIQILEKDKKNFEILLLTANKNISAILLQAKKLHVKNIIITDPIRFLELKSKLKSQKINIFNNFNSFNKILRNKKVDYTMNAISGLEGVSPTLKVIKFSKNIAIANKESIICGWSLIQSKLNKYKTKFIPIDSEHFSIWSLIEKAKNKNIEKIFITASGGPFNNLALYNFKSITPKLALKHPSWKMGKKISIDSATMMNKIFEVIEARKIFNFDYKKIDILIHSKSYVHAIVKFKNGLTKMLIHDTDMAIPIFNTLYQNNEMYIRSRKINFDTMNNLDFKLLDPKRFPVIKILSDLSKKNSLFETIVVSANDELVNLFIQKKIKFLDISKFLLKIVKIKEFTKFKHRVPKNVNEINTLSKYVSLKINSMCI